MSLLRNWPYWICKCLSETPSKSATVVDVINYVLKIYPSYTDKKKKMKSSVLHAISVEKFVSKKKGRCPRFIKCSNTSKVVLTDFQWENCTNLGMVKKNEYSPTSQISDCIESNDLQVSSPSIKRNENDENVGNTSNMEFYAGNNNEGITLPYFKTASYEPTDSKKEFPSQYDKKKNLMRGKELYEVINLSSEEEDNGKEPEKICPICKLRTKV